MVWATIVTLAGGALTQVAIAHPFMPTSQSDHPTKLADSWGLVWLLVGVLHYFSAMFDLWRWWGVILGWPVAVILGFIAVSVARPVFRIAVYLGPVLAIAGFYMLNPPSFVSAH
jgi:hypothetical protein